MPYSLWAAAVAQSVRTLSLHATGWDWCMLEFQVVKTGSNSSTATCKCLDNLQSFTSNGDVSIWVKNSRVEKIIHLTLSRSKHLWAELVYCLLESFYSLTNVLLKLLAPSNNQFSNNAKKNVLWQPLVNVEKSISNWYLLNLDGKNDK